MTTHEHPPPPTDEAGWDERYSSAPMLFSGNPNRALVALVEEKALTAGTALDVGCGEGGDAVWLAGRGWRVTGTDISSVALSRAAAAAGAAGVADRCHWVHADLDAAGLPTGPFDLVNAEYLHLPSAQRPALWAALAAAVRPGGTLLVAGHDASDPHIAQLHHLADRFHGVEEIVAGLGTGWDIGFAGPVEGRRPEGSDTPGVDVVVRAQRHG
jgi:SAM-dependent methyltransferase